MKNKLRNPFLVLVLFALIVSVSGDFYLHRLFGQVITIRPDQPSAQGWSVGGRQIVDADSIYLRDYVYHDGDADTYAGFDAADAWGLWIGGTQVLDADSSSVEASGTITAATGAFTTLVTPYEKTISISPSGGDYATIQAALDANTSGGELFLVYPGTYTDDTIAFTADNQQVRCMAVSPAECHLTTANANIIDYGAYTGCKVYKIKATVTAATSLVHTVQGSTGSCNFRQCHISMTTAYTSTGAQPSCYHSSGAGTVKMREGTIDYDHTGVVGGATSIKAAIFWDTNAATYDMRHVNIDIDAAGGTTATTIGYGTGAAVVDVNNSVGELDDTDTAIPAGFYVGGAGTQEFVYNTIHVTGGQTNAYGIYVAGTPTIRGMFNHIHVTGATNNYSYELVGAATLASQFEDIVAAKGINNAGGATVTVLNSPADGELQIGTFLNLDAQTEISVANGAVFTPTGSYQLIAAAAEVTPTISTSGYTAGDELELHNTEAQVINIEDTGTAKLTAAFAMGQYDVLVLRFDGTNWIELSRSNN